MTTISIIKLVNGCIKYRILVNYSDILKMPSIKYLMRKSDSFTVPSIDNSIDYMHSGNNCYRDLVYV